MIGSRRCGTVLLAAMFWLAAGLGTARDSAPASARSTVRPASAEPSVFRPQPARPILGDLKYGRHADQRADVYRPRWTARSSAALVVVHGGGWRSGNKESWRDLSMQLAAAGFLVVAIDYREATATYPGFPNQVEELEQAVTWLRGNARAWHVDPARVGALGSSSGANLVAMLAFDGAGPLTSGARIKAAVTWSAPLDLTVQPWLSGPADFYVGCHTACTAKLVAASPMNYVSKGDTPIAMFNSADEAVPLAQVRQTAERLGADRVPYQLTVYPGSAHGTSYAQRAMPATIAFLTSQLS